MEDQQLPLAVIQAQRPLMVALQDQVLRRPDLLLTWQSDLVIAGELTRVTLDLIVNLRHGCTTRLLAGYYATGKPYPVTVEGGFSKPIKCKTDRKFADTVREVLQAEHTVALLRSVLARYS